jgi:hypothetical protein
VSLIKIGQALALCLLTLPLLSETSKALDGSMYGDYVKSFSPADPVMSFGVGLSQKMTSSLSLFLRQDLVKNLVIDSSKEEIELQDSRFGVRLYPKSLIENVNWVLSLSATLPVSKSSRDNEIYSKPEIYLGVDYSASTWLTIDASVYGRYNVSKFETAPAQGGTGGDPLQKYSYGLGQGMTLHNETLSFGYRFSYREATYYKVEQNSATTALISDLPDQGYSIGIFITAMVWDQGSVTLGFDQGSALIQKGWEDYVLYDKEESSWSIGFAQGF